MGQVSRIIGGIILIVSFCAYHFLELRIDDKADIVYWLPNMIGISLLSLGVGLDEKNVLLKHLFYYTVSTFFASLAVMYSINEFIDFLINVNIVILSLIITSIICLLLYFFKSLFN